MHPRGTVGSDGSSTGTSIRFVESPRQRSTSRGIFERALMAVCLSFQKFPEWLDSIRRRKSRSATLRSESRLGVPIPASSR